MQVSGPNCAKKQRKRLILFFTAPYYLSATSIFYLKQKRVTQSHFTKRTNPARAYSDRACLFLNGAFESAP